VSVNVGTAVAYLDLNMTAFNSGLQQAQSALQTFQSDTTSTGQKLMSAGGVITNVGSSLTRNLTMPIANAGKEIVNFGATFDKSMSNVKSVMQPTTQEFEDLRQSAMDWGGKTVYTADEAAQALYYMGLAGWETEESIAALGGVLNLAAAGQLDLGQTSDIVTDSMTALHLSADGVSEGVNSADWYVNLLAATMANSNTTVDKLGESFRYVASAVGGIESPMYSAEDAARDTAFALGILANNGIKSSQAGTTLRRVILNLEKPTETVQKGLDGLNLSLEDVDMTTNGVKGVIDKFRGSVRDLLPYLDEEQIAHLQVDEGVSEEDAQMQLYNQTMELVQQGVIDTTQQQVLMNIAQVSGAYAVAGLTSLVMTQQESYDDLYNTLLNSNEQFVKHGEEIYTISEAYSIWGDEIYNNSEQFEILGAAEGMAEVQMDNLQGSWVRFTSALDTTKILLSDLIKNELRGIVDRLTELVEWFNKLDKEQQKNILKWGLIIAAIGPVLMIFGSLLRSIGLIAEGFGLLSPLIHTVTTILGQLHAEGSILHGVLGLLQQGISALFSPMTGWIALIALVIVAVIDLWRNNEEFRDDVIRIWETISSFIKGAWDSIKPIFETLLDLFFEIAKAIEPIISTLVSVLAPVLEVILGVVGFILEVLSPLIEVIASVLVPVIEVIGEALKIISPVIEFIADLVGTFVSLVLEPLVVILDGIATMLKGLADGIKEWWGGVIDWITDKVDKFVDWWNNLAVVKAVKSIFDGIGELFSGGGLKIFSGSHKDGLAYVPYDGYVAELHKGERVLTSDENKDYSNGSVGNGTTINFYSNEKIDEYVAARELKRTMHDIELGLV
jgi:TP901 family phage tail tape measure protein